LVKKENDLFNLLTPSWQVVCVSFIQLNDTVI
jgi:hypothetical protein